MYEAMQQRHRPPVPPVHTECTAVLTALATGLARTLECGSTADCAAAIEELTAHVTAISFQPYGQFVITLDNDQVWAQKQTDTKVKPRVGESVTIKAGTFGSFILVTPSGRSTRVARVR